MKYTKINLLAILLIVVAASCKKETVDPNSNQNITRYNGEVFSQADMEANVVYGSATTQGGVTQDLTMDVFTPSGDTEANRPLVILAHGGGFQGGEKESMHDLARFFAKSGYVAVSLKYRIVDIPTSPLVMTKAVIDGTHDMRAAIRFFRKDQTTTNKYKINPNNIFAGGYSAGGFMGLHTAFLNQESEVMDLGGQELVNYWNAAGGMEGNSGNAGYSSEIRGAISLAGALGKANFINAGEPMVYSFHGTADEVVPYNSGDSDGSGVITEGPGIYHSVANSVGVKSEVRTVDGGIHDVFWETNGSYAELRTFIYNNLQP